LAPSATPWTTRSWNPRSASNRLNLQTPTLLSRLC
jgi:hypothetical protein